MSDTLSHVADSHTEPAVAVALVAEPIPSSASWACTVLSTQRILCNAQLGEDVRPVASCPIVN